MMPRAARGRPTSLSDVNLGRFQIKPSDRHGQRDCNSYLMTSRWRNTQSLSSGGASRRPPVALAPYALEELRQTGSANPPHYTSPKTIGDESPNPLALMRSAHHLHGIFEMTPLSGLIGLAPALAGDRILGCLGDRLEAVLLEHLPRDHMNLHFGDHVVLLIWLFGERHDLRNENSCDRAANVREARL